MLLETYVVGMIENNNYLLIDEKSKEAVLFDCSERIDEIKEKLDEVGADLKYIFITHGHFDHILGINDMIKLFPKVQVIAPEKDKELIEDVKSFVNMFVGNIGNVEIPNVSKYIDENDEFFIGDEKIKIVSTPGHTLGGVCYFVDDKLFTGDTIFLESVGRTDLPGGSYLTLKQSVKNILEMFDDNVKIYAGHGDSSTVAHEKKYNPAI